MLGISTFTKQWKTESETVHVADEIRAAGGAGWRAAMGHQLRNVGYAVNSAGPFGDYQSGLLRSGMRLHAAASSRVTFEAGTKAELAGLGDQLFDIHRAVTDGSMPPQRAQALTEMITGRTTQIATELDARPRPYHGAARVAGISSAAMAGVGVLGVTAYGITHSPSH